MGVLGRRDSRRTKGHWEVGVPVVLPLSLLVLVPPVAVALWEAGGQQRWQTGTLVALVTRDAVLLVGAAISYLNWRLTSSATLAWYASAFIAVSLHLMTFDMLALAAQDGPRALAPEQNPDLIALLPLPVLFFLALRGQKVPRSLDPLAIAVIVALGTGTLRMIQLYQGSAVARLQLDNEKPVAAVMLVIGIVACTLLAHSWTLPGSTRKTSTVAGAVLLASQTATVVAPTGSARATMAALGTVGAVFALAGCLEMLSATTHAAETSADLIRSGVGQTDPRALRDREVLHELRATVAGITKAATLLRHSETVLPQVHRTQLERMIDGELARMERLLDDRPLRDRRRVDIDEMIEPLVVAQRALGYQVCWEPSGIEVAGSPDEIVEAVHILLSNAGRHASHGPATIDVNREPTGMVAIRISDSGPGVDQEVKAHLFERGVHARSSSGEGIGLHIARRLVRDQGGDLRHEANRRSSGSTFVVVLPSPDQESSS